MGKEARVVCEYRLNGECHKEGCPAYRENKVSSSECKKTESGQLYYTYNCGQMPNVGSVKLLDILFLGDPKKVNPNFSFMKKKGKLNFR
jgi:hypothetical protein